MTTDPIGDIDDAQGRQLLDSDGQPLGQIREIFLDETTGRPAWAAVDAPGGGNDLVLAPLAHSTREGDALRVAVTREQVETSPSTAGLAERFSPDHMDRVRAHYDQPAGVADLGPGRATVAGELPSSMIRSEEALFVEHERVPRERVRLVKRIVTETVTQTVEVRREELHFERIPLTPGGEGATHAEPAGVGPVAGEPPSGISTETGEGIAPSIGTGGLSALKARASSLVGKAGERLSGAQGFGETFTPETLDLTLYEEHVVVSKRVVPRERVRIHREIVTEQQRITDDLRKEQIEVQRIGLGGDPLIDAETGGEGTHRPDTAV